jgi:hypothetical protein
MENLGELASWAERYGKQCFRDGEMAERERYQRAGGVR